MTCRSDPRFSVVPPAGASSPFGWLGALGRRHGFAPFIFTKISPAERLAFADPLCGEYLDKGVA